MAEKQQTETKKGAKKASSAQKRHLQSLKKRSSSRGFKAQVRTAIRACEELVKSRDIPAAQAQLSAVYGLMDKGVKTGRFKLNKAARTKSRLSAALRSKA